MQDPSVEPSWEPSWDPSVEPSVDVDVRQTSQPTQPNQPTVCARDQPSQRDDLQFPTSVAARQQDLVQGSTLAAAPDNCLPTPGCRAAELPHMDIFVMSTSKCFKIRVDMTTTLQQFTRAIQHKATFGILKANMSLERSTDGPAGPWAYFYSFRFRSQTEEEMYGMRLIDLGIGNGTWLQVSYVTNGWQMAFLGVGAALALPVALVGAAGAAIIGAGGYYVAGYMISALAVKYAGQRAFHYVRMELHTMGLPEQIISIEIVT